MHISLFIIFIIVLDVFKSKKYNEKSSYIINRISGKFNGNEFRLCISIEIWITGNMWNGY